MTTRSVCRHFPDRSTLAWAVAENGYTSFDGVDGPKCVVNCRRCRVVITVARRPDARLRFDLAGARGGTGLRWTLCLDDPLPEARFVKRLFQRIRVLIDANLPCTCRLTNRACVSADDQIDPVWASINPILVLDAHCF